MSTFNNPPKSEGDALTAAEINAAAGTSLETPVNALATGAIERYALDAQHLPSPSFSDVFSSGYEAGSANNVEGQSELVYDNGLPLTTVNTAYPYTYQTFDSLSGTNGAGTNVANYGATDDIGGALTYTPATSHIYDGWRIPASSWINNKAEVALASATTFTAVNISGVLCRAEVEPLYAADPTRGASSTPSAIYPGISSVALAIGWEDGAGNRHVVERSVRFYSVAACKRGNASTFTYLRQEDLDDGDGTCAKIFMVVACVRPGDIEAASTGSPYRTGDPAHYFDHLVLRAYNLSTTPVRAGSLT